MKAFTIHTVNNGVLSQRQAKHDEAYEDVGSVADIKEGSKIQPFEMLLGSVIYIKGIELTVGDFYGT